MTTFNWKTHPWVDMVGPGWADLVQPLVDYAIDHDLPIFDVKEKFGGLRFYGSFDETLMEMADGAERASERVCETCGKKGEVRMVRGWFRCECLKHHRERGK